MKNDHEIDLKEIALRAMEKYGFATRFPEALIQETDALEERIFPEEPEGNSDLRRVNWSSIDNEDSMDLDQLEYCESGPDGEIEVKIAIADVDTYVRSGSRADRYAAHNGTSVYTGIVTFPMLPDRLSKGMTSLLPGKDRMAVIIAYSVLPDGSARHGSITRGLVSNKAKLIYEQVGDWLEGIGPIPDPVRDVPGMEKQIRLQDETACRLRKYRMQQGALDLDTIEAQAVMAEGSVRDIVVRKQNRAHWIIEEFMVAANGSMVDFLGRAGTPLIQRVVRIPKNWQGIVSTAAGYHEMLPTQPDSKALSLFLGKQKENDPVHFPDLSLTIVKLLGPGEYVTLAPGDSPAGHFALAVTDYTHATAPNRRYVDIINQRLLKSVLDGAQPPYTTKELDANAEWLTDREKASKKVERFMRKSAAAVLLGERIGELFDALVTGVTGHGTYARLIAPPAEGRIVVGEKGLKVGDRIRVRLLKTDPYNGFIDFEHVRFGRT
ncbi:MAG TPA: RNB domain-containing ribonuclease [Methanoregulaceae archaeon]|nr:RNB domain-containing ribonuclease [Methanoregulaceae archaeon]